MQLFIYFYSADKTVSYPVSRKPVSMSVSDFIQRSQSEADRWHKITHVAKLNWARPTEKGDIIANFVIVIYHEKTYNSYCITYLYTNNDSAPVLMSNSFSGIYCSD